MDLIKDVRKSKSDLLKQGLSILDRTLTSTEIRALFTSGIDLIPAPGAGKLLTPVQSVYYYDRGSVSYNLNAGVTELSYGPNEFISQLTFLSAAADTVYSEGSPGVQIAAANCLNQPIRIRHTVANPTLGDGTLRIQMLYRKVTVF